MIRYLLIMFFFMAGYASALTEKEVTTKVANVTKHRMHSVAHKNPKAGNMYILYINGLQEGCSKLYLYADKDPFLFAAVLSGLSSSETSTIQIFYHTDQSRRGPWGDSSACELTSFAVNS